MSNNKSLAFNAERLRQLMWQRVAPPPELLQKAIMKLDQQLEATETKFFVDQGLVTSQVDVPAHSIQQQAAINIVKMSDGFPRDKVDKAGPPSVTLEIKDGVFRLHIGAVPSSGEEVAYDPAQLNGDENIHTIDAPTTEQAALVPAAPQQQPFVAPPTPFEDVDDEPPTQVVSMKDFAIRKEAMRLLLGDDSA